MSRSVVFTALGALLLRDVRRDAEGRVKAGHVVNGAWDFEVREGEQLAKAGNTIVNRRPDSPFREVEVPAGLGGDYNRIIAWAEGRKT